jgi:murein DD-endopeptidase MepM/ murein hydrolase activator NlpD
VNLSHPLQFNWPISSNYQGHLDRKPPSTAPGLDFAAPSMTPVYAAFSGRVSGCRYRGAGGRSLYITHDRGVKAYYAHLSWLCVLGQERIYRGQHIGFVGNTGRSTGPHLHFSVKVNGEWVDPEPMLERG